MTTPEKRVLRQTIQELQAFVTSPAISEHDVIDATARIEALTWALDYLEEEAQHAL